MTSRTRRTTVDEVVDVLRRRILTGEIGAGEKIQQDALASELGISRIPVREALSRLGAEGLIETQAHRSPLVSPLTIRSAREIFALRAALEAHLIEAAMQNEDRMKGNEAPALLQKFKSRSDFDPLEWCSLNQDFHDALYAPSNMPFSMSMLRTVWDQSARFIVKQISMDGRPKRAYEQHSQLLEMYEKGRKDELKTFLYDHTMNVVPDLQKLGLPEG
jgi:DNA-binding GntR family transcriptional regulator